VNYFRRKPEKNFDLKAKEKHLGSSHSEGSKISQGAINKKAYFSRVATGDDMIGG